MECVKLAFVGKQVDDNGAGEAQGKTNVGRFDDGEAEQLDQSKRQAERESHLNGADDERWSS